MKMSNDLDYDRHLAQLEHWRDRDAAEGLETCEWCGAEEVYCEWHAVADMNICEDCRPTADWYAAIYNNVRLLVRMANGEESQEYISAQDVADTVLEAVREKIEL